MGLNIMIVIGIWACKGDSNIIEGPHYKCAQLSKIFQCGTNFIIILQASGSS